MILLIDSKVRILYTLDASLNVSTFAESGNNLHAAMLLVVSNYTIDWHLGQKNECLLFCFQ